MTRYYLLVAFALCAMPGEAWSSTANADERVERASSRACSKAAGLIDSKVGPATRFSDAHAVDVRTVTGRWPQAHMRKVRATMLCLYERRSGKAEVQELVR